MNRTYLIKNIAQKSVAQHTIGENYRSKLAKNGLLQAAEEFATYITENYERLAKQAKSIPEPKPIKQRTPDEQGRKREDSLQKANMKRVYIFDMGNGTVKIGVSNNIGARRQTIMFSSGLPINKYCYSDFLPTSTAVAIEQTCHKYFADQNTLGEFFAVSYQEAKAYLATHVRLVDNTTNLLS